MSHVGDFERERKWAYKTEIRLERWHMKMAEKLWKIYTFANTIRLIVLLNTGKLVKFYQNVFSFFKL